MMRRLGGAGGIIGYFTRHPTAANLLLVVMLALGLASVPQMRAQFFPDVVSDDIDLTVVWPGAGAEAVDEAVVGVIEPALLAIEGVTDTEARASEGRASFEVTFEPGWDMSRASNDVDTALDAITDLPEGAEDPEIRRSTWRDRVTDVVVTGPVGVDQLARIADALSNSLFQAGVTRTSIAGIADGEILVEVPQRALVQYDITLREVAEAIGAEADASQAGEVGGTARIRAGSARRDADSIAAIVLRVNEGGDALRIGDVARIETLGVDRDAAYFVGGDLAITLRVERSASGDAIAIQRQVEEIAADLSFSLPQGVTIDLIRTRADYISGRLEILLDNAATGLALVVALLFLFLNARTAFWVAAGIPVAMTAAIALMYAAGLTFNMISLFALIITLGIVVDDAIVVGEHADFRARNLGEDPKSAAENAARRMFAPVLSATLTTVIAFFGLVAIGGTFGTLIADIPFTVIVVLMASLVECFLILPNHMAHSIGNVGGEKWYDLPSRLVNRGFAKLRERAFRPLMRMVVWARYPVLAGAMVLLSVQGALFLTGDVTWRFFNSPEEGSVSGNFAMAAGASREDTLEQIALLQQTVDEVAQSFEDEYGVSPVDYAIAQIGGSAGRGLSGTENTDADLLGAISIELIEPDLRPFSSSEFVAALQDAVPRHPQLEQISFRGWRSGPGGDALDVELFGASAGILKEAAEALKSELSQFPEVSGLEDSLAYDKQELVLTLTPQGEALGVSIDALGRVLRDRLSGIEAASFPDGQRSATIRVELPESERAADFLDRAVIRTDAGLARVGDLVSIDVTEGFSTIRRENGIRLASVIGDISEDDPARASDIMFALETEILPRLEQDFGIQTSLSGLAEDEAEFLTDAVIGFSLCLLGIYLTLAWIFASWTRPLVVMAVIPFGLVGAVWGHYVWDMPLSIFTVVGMIGMTGIVINDSIVLVTTIDEYAENRGLVPAIVDAACDRLRPVLLTTLTTVLGLAPLLYESSSQAQFLKPTVITLVYGLGFGMFLVLLLVPAILAIGQDFGRHVRAFRRLTRGGHATGGARALLLATGGLQAMLFTATLGTWLVTGRMVGPLTSFGSGPWSALSVFLAGSVALLFAATLAGLFLLRPRGRAA
ncbi:efflux RND transporter permease subunit [Palleronia sp. LCG004]|uniref:efflux RND transporter permease subunit n=1 Tax=Palleronia sp. LCG004 TaxID=3079304 RepID=UPI00294391B3|nr:efflux RND transporter permease subunit [Palleronia sp. LCG004]WOI55470.1 efflux RND transporter permease subunit [Palleronia sp. LCG004]